MAHPNEVAIRDALEAFSTGDVEAGTAILSPDIVWHEGGRNQLTGDHRGIDAVFGLFGKMAELTEGTFRIDEVHDVLANDDHAVSLHRTSAQRSGKTYRFNDAIVRHMSDGKVTEAWVLGDDQHAWDELFA